MEFNNPNQDKDSHSSFCFATLALGAPYWAAAIRLASDLATHAPGKSLVVLTDNPLAFRNQCNIIPHFHRQKGLFNCWNDKRFAVQVALEHTETVVLYDADTRISQPLPEKLEIATPLATDWTPNFHYHTTRYQNPKERNIIFKTCRSFGVDPNKIFWINDSFYVIRRDSGRETTFLHIWDNVAEQFDLAGIVSTDATCMGISIASAVIGWNVAEGESGEIAPFYLARTHLSEGGERENRKRPIWRRALKRISNKFLVTRKRLEYVARGP
jgi:hypothetical protein